MNHNQLLVVISGPSGTGKGTVCEQLLKEDDIFLSISATSREKRAGETDGVTYHYCTEEQFRQMIDAGQMLEWACYSGNYYGTPRDKVLKMMEDGKDVLLEIDVQGALQVKRAYPNAVLIFLLPPSLNELQKRLVQRGRETEQQIAERIDAAYEELRAAEKYDYVVVNDVLSKCVKAVNEIMRSEKRRVCRCGEQLKQLEQELKK